MIIVMQQNATPQQIKDVAARVEDLGFRAHLSTGEERTIIGVIGDERQLQGSPLEILPGVERIVPILAPYKLASRDFKSQNTVVKLGDIAIGGDAVVVIAGPCAV